MSQYQAPLAEMQYVLNELAGLDQVAQLPGYEEATADVAVAILEEASKFATNVLDPLNAVGDRESSRRLDDGTSGPTCRSQPNGEMGIVTQEASSK